MRRKNETKHQVPIIVRTIVLGSIVYLTVVLGTGIYTRFISPSTAGGQITPAGTHEPDQAAARESDIDTPGGILIFSRQGRSILVADPITAAKKGIIDLSSGPGLPVSLIPTPGGVSVFVLFDNSPEIVIYSTTDYNEQRTVSFDKRIPEDLTFSENGDTVFMTWKDSPVISVYSHAQLELSLQQEYEIHESFGPVLRNRRATRIYRQTPEGLAVIFARTGEVLEIIPGRAASWRFNSSRTRLWGVTADGEVQTVDERTSRRRGLENSVEEALFRHPVIPEGHETVFVLLHDLSRVAVIDDRTGRLVTVMHLPFDVQFLADSGVESVWAVGDEGRFAAIDPASFSLKNTGVIPAVQQGQEMFERIDDVVSSIVRTGGNFACF